MAGSALDLSELRAARVLTQEGLFGLAQAGRFRERCRLRLSATARRLERHDRRLPEARRRVAETAEGKGQQAMSDTIDEVDDLIEAERQRREISDQPAPQPTI